MNINITVTLPNEEIHEEIGYGTIQLDRVKYVISIPRRMEEKIVDSIVKNMNLFWRGYGIITTVEPKSSLMS